MRVAVSGSANTGKSTFIKDFLKNWEGIYSTPEQSYRDIIKEKKLKHSDKTTRETQKIILDSMVESHMAYTKNDNIIFDRCPLDNIIYSLHSYDKESSDIDSDFIDGCIPIVKETMKFIDIILYIPYDARVAIQQKENRVTKEEYILEIDNIFKEVERQYHAESSPFFQHDDRPALISITGSARERIKQASLYITEDGDGYQEGDSAIDWEELAQFGISPKDVFPDGVVR